MNEEADDIEQRRKRREELKRKLNSVTDANEPPAAEQSNEPTVIATENRQPKSMKKTNLEEDSDGSDMFASDDDKVDGARAKKNNTGKKLDASWLDSWDDVEGYYKIISGELLDERYLITATLGKGMFAEVVRATVKDDKDNNVVAIKIIRNNETMKKAAQREIQILENLNNNTGIVNLIRHFEHKGHLCLVFENLNSNLRDVLKKYGRNVGINITAVQVYTKQLLRGLIILKNCGYIHADLKLDNILVNESNTIAKIADLGSASTVSELSEQNNTPYLVSRFYRAPEIMLGITPSLGYPIDMWALGCSLFEIYTGQILFPGKTNNEMLKLIMECKGKFPHKLIRKGQFSNEHFDLQLLDFQSLVEDKLTGRMLMRTTKNVGPIPEQSLKVKLRGSEDDGDLLEQFIDLLDKMLILTPEKRITPEQALNHPFLH